jgi:hypothetical protein
MLEGSIRITKLSYDPQIYAVAFVPLPDTMTGLSWRECIGLEEVRDLLETAGVWEDEIASALRTAYQTSSASIRGVVLDEATLERLGLRIPRSRPT